MVKTGYISFIVETGGGQDADHNPVQPVKNNTEYVPCNLATVTKKYLTLIDQQYKQANYSCYIENGVLSSLAIDLPTITEVQIQDNDGNDLGVFQVQNVEYLNLVQQTKVVV